MNRLVILFAIVVGFTYFGGSGVPKILVDNKKVLLGITLGLLIGSFNLGNFNRVEGLFDKEWEETVNVVEGKDCNCNGNVGAFTCGAKIQTIPSALHGATNSDGAAWTKDMDQCKGNETCDLGGIGGVECAGSKHYNGKCTANSACQ